MDMTTDCTSEQHRGLGDWRECESPHCQVVVATTPEWARRTTTTTTANTTIERAYDPDGPVGWDLFVNGE